MEGYVSGRINDLDWPSYLYGSLPAAPTTGYLEERQRISYAYNQRLYAKGLVGAA